MAVIILAGGMSSRMGREKASLDLRGSTFLDTLIERFSRGFGQVIVVQNAGQHLDLHPDVIPTTDIFQNCGPLGGIHAGLAISPDHSNLIVACDLPFASPVLAQHLLSRLDDYDAVVPMLVRGAEPLFAGYRRSILPQVEASLESSQLRIRTLLNSINTLYVPEEDLRYIEPDLRSFLNVNTPEEYQQILENL